jgi:hypothetical protein
MLAEGGIPQGDYVPAPWLNTNAGWAAWVETWGAGLELDLRASLARDDDPGRRDPRDAGEAEKLPGRPHRRVGYGR